MQAVSTHPSTNKSQLIISFLTGLRSRSSQAQFKARSKPYTTLLCSDISCLSLQAGDCFDAQGVSGDGGLGVGGGRGNERGGGVFLSGAGEGQEVGGLSRELSCRG